MRNRFAAAVAMAVTVVLSSAAFAAAADVVPVVATTHSRIHLIKGRVRAIDVTRLVVVGSGGRQSFVLTPETERIGNVRVGSSVDVSYHKDGKERIASAVVVTRWKTPPSTSRSQY